MTSPVNQLESFRIAFADAERDWIRWRKTPANHREGYDSSHVSTGPVLLARMLEAMAAYQAYAQAETQLKIDNAARNGIPLVELSPEELEEELDIPPFLRREAQ